MNMSGDPTLEELESIVGHQPYAVIQYGSRVAGYATETSDYDYIYIVDGYRDGIRYIYRDVRGLNTSILVVDKQFFEEDVFLAKHGEFVAGRLYGVYRPIHNPDYIHRMEVLLKRRAILEELSLLKMRYGGFLAYMEIPVKYFLLARLWKRIMAYPPVRYSYYKMFYGPRGSENTEASLRGFEAACLELADMGFFRYGSGIVYDVDYDRIPSNFLDVVRLGLRGVSMYYTHGRSASVGVDVFLEEVRSKIRRGGESMRIPRELENPDILLRLRGCFFTVEDIDLDTLVKVLYGSDAEVVRQEQGGLLSSLDIVEVARGPERFKVVVKRFPLYSTLLKWIWIYTWLLGYKSFEIEPGARMFREFHGLNILRRLGIRVPRVYAVLWSEKMLVEEFIEGERLDRSGDYRFFSELGRLLARIHSKLGVSLGDTKPQNMIVSGDDLYIIDLEQFATDDRVEWDLGEAILYSFILGRRRGEEERIMGSILRGYLEECGECIGNVKNILNPRIVLAFLPLVPVTVFLKLRRVIHSLVTRT